MLRPARLLDAHAMRFWHEGAYNRHDTCPKIAESRGTTELEDLQAEHVQLGLRSQGGGQGGT